jgi:hypothetical protein
MTDSDCDFGGPPVTGSQRYSRGDGVIGGGPDGAAFIPIHQSGGNKRRHIFVHLPAVATDRLGQSVDIGCGTDVQTAEKLQPPGRQHAGHRFESFEGQMTLVNRFAALCTPPSVDKTVGEILRSITDVDFKIGHHTSPPAARTSARKSAINFSGDENA